jgi:hypothetical protein
VGLRDIISNLRGESQTVEETEKKIENLEKEEASDLEQGDSEQAAEEEREIIQLLRETEQGVMKMLQMDDTEFEFFMRYLDTEVDIRKRQLEAINQAAEFTDVIKPLLDDMESFEKNENTKPFLASYVRMQRAQRGNNMFQASLYHEEEDFFYYDDESVRKDAAEVMNEIIQKANDPEIGIQAVKNDIQRQCEDTRQKAADDRFETHKSGEDVARQVSEMVSERSVEAVVEYGETYKEFVEALKNALDRIKKVKIQEQRLEIDMEHIDMDDESAVDDIKQDIETSMADIKELAELVEEEDELDSILSQGAQDNATHQALQEVEGNLSEIFGRFGTLEEKIQSIENREEEIEEENVESTEHLDDLLNEFRGLNGQLQKSNLLTQEEKSNISTYIGNLESIIEEAIEDFSRDENRLEHEEKTVEQLDKEMRELEQKFQQA